MEYEQKKEVLKRKSECFDQLLVIKSEKRICPAPDSSSPSSSQDSGLPPDITVVSQDTGLPPDISVISQVAEEFHMASDSEET